LNYRVEFENLPEENLEIRYFDNHHNSSYLSWKLPKNIAEELVVWWKKISDYKNIDFPVKKKTKTCELNMPTEKHIDIRGIDKYGNFQMTGWSLPRVAVEKLVVWYEKSK